MGNYPNSTWEHTYHLYRWGYIFKLIADSQVWKLKATLVTRGFEIGTWG